MKTGIYKITFPSGNFYIGKSIDIDKRWKQHSDAFVKGKHTKNMQAEYDLYGDYTAEVLFECHEDHIDIIEESYIANLCPPLNGTKGRDRLASAADHLEIFLSYFNMSTLEHIVGLHNSKNTINNLKEKIAEKEHNISWLDEFIEKLKIQRSIEEIEYDVGCRIRVLQDAWNNSLDRNFKLDAHVAALEVQLKELIAYKKLPWYKKLFN